MAFKSKMDYRRKIKKGFTLIELMVVISIMAIISVVVVPTYTGDTKKAKEKVCNVNCLQVEKRYEMYLDEENLAHSDSVLKQFLQDYGKNICPEHSEINYVDGKVKFSVHTIDDASESDDEDVPFL